MSSNGLVFKYGSYSHLPGEVFPSRLEVRPLVSEDGVRWATDYRMHVSGSFVNQVPELDADGVNTRINEVEQAYQNDYQDAMFLLPDGTETQHRMISNDPFNLSGNRVFNFSWDNRFPTEFANTRSFSVTIGARYLTNYWDILYFTETTTRIGDGGPLWRMYNLWDGTPVKEFITNSSKVTHVQSGLVVGLYTWPTVPQPYWPAEEQTWRRKISQVSPKFHGDLSFLKGTHWAVAYTYYFERTGPQPFNPNWFYGV